MKHVKSKLSVLSLAIFSSQVMAVPFIDSKIGLRDLNDSASLRTTYFLGTEVDGDATTVYIPYTKVEVVRDANDVPMFSFAYGRKGAIMTTTLRAVAEEGPAQAVFEQAKEALKARGYPERSVTAAYLPVHKGLYTSTLKDINTGAEFIIGTNSVETAIPSNNVVLSVFMNRAAADLVVLSLQSPYTVLGFNYQYDFPGRTTPYKAKISIDWKSVYTYVRSQFGLRTIVSSVDIDVVVRRLIETQKIVIDIVEGDQRDNVMGALVSDIAKIVISKTFKAHHPDPQSQKLNVQRPNVPVVSFLASGLGPWSVGVSAGYSLEVIDSREQITQTYLISSFPYRTFTATAGGQLPGNCEEFPMLFAYEGQYDAATNSYPVMHGCPNIYGPDMTPPVDQQNKPDPGTYPAQPSREPVAPVEKDKLCKTIPSLPQCQ